MKILNLMKKLYFILTFLVALVVGLKAQQFPVQAQIQMIPPVSPYLSDWSEGFPNRILLNVTLVDGFESGYPVRLRWTITGNGGVTLKTNPNIIPTPITLNFGVPRNLTGAEVAQYLNPDNLEFTGLARNTFIESGGKLPESAGPYTICVEVLDFNRFDGFPVSAPACAIANAIELDPPLLIAPEGVVDALPIQNVLFQWQPTHLGAFPVNYTLQVFEKVEGMSNDLVLQTQVPLFQNQILMNTSYMFGASAPSLTLGKEYIYRVQIIDPLGMNHFKNYGYSEIGSFIYGEEEEEVSCLPPTNGSFAEVTTNSIGVAWNPAAAADNYLVSYRNIDADGNWYEDEVLGENEQIIADLEPATNYEVRVKTLCAGETESDWLTIGATITDSIINPRIYECGDEVILADIDQSTALGSIDAVEFLIYRGFPIFIEDISGSNGNFSGVGKIGLPFGKKNLAVELDVSVNELGEIYAGTVSAIRDNAHNYDLNPEPIVVGEEICQEPEEVIVGFDENGLYQPSGLPYDPFGFGPAGEYIIEPPYVGYEEGDPYDANFDPNGFDANGNYLGTDTPFNEDGCDRLGLDSLGSSFSCTDCSRLKNHSRR